MMSAVPPLCAGFLLGVLWMDLMHDVQVLGHPARDAELPEAVIASIAGYYRRVTTEASPMGHLVGAVMLLLLGTLAVEILRGKLAALASLPLCAAPILLAMLRVVPNAVRLGARTGSAREQSALARAICRDHLICFASMLAFVVVGDVAA